MKLDVSAGHPHDPTQVAPGGWPWPSFDDEETAAPRVRRTASGARLVEAADRSWALALDAAGVPLTPAC
jgi:hypothetical protein